MAAAGAGAAAGFAGAIADFTGAAFGACFGGGDFAGRLAGGALLAAGFPCVFALVDLIALLALPGAIEISVPGRSTEEPP